MVVEELLKFFVDKVNGDLLEAVVLKDLKSSNVKNGTEVGLLQRTIDESVVAFLRRLVLE